MLAGGMGIDLTPNLKDSTVEMLTLAAADIDALYRVSSDQLLWVGHPSTDRYKRDVFDQWFESAMVSKTALKIKDRGTGEIIGSTRFYDYKPGFSVAIGYTFIAREFWGGNINYRVKSLMLNYAFQEVANIWFHIDPSNIRSQKATEKRGAVLSHTEEKVLSGGSKKYFCYKMMKQDSY